MRRVLIAIDGSEDASKAVEYVANLFRGAPDLEVSLLHIYPAVPPIYIEEQHDPQIRARFKAWQNRREEEAKQYIGRALEILQGQGFKESQIAMNHRQQIVGVARDIVWEADAQRVNGIVIGKKGLSRIEEFFLGSITNKLLELSVDHPLWLVEGATTSKKLLIALDETEHATAAVRYAGEMLKDIEGIEILLYHCCVPFSDVVSDEEITDLKEVGGRYIERKREKMSYFFDEAKKHLIDLGFDDGVISTRFHYDLSLTDKKVSRSILSYAEKERIGTIVMGRKGSTHAREFAMGSVCRRIITEAKNCVLWVV